MRLESVAGTHWIALRGVRPCSGLDKVEAKGQKVS